MPVLMANDKNDDGSNNEDDHDDEDDDCPQDQTCHIKLRNTIYNNI